MDIARTAPIDRQNIQKYGNGRFTVSGTVFTGGVLVLPAQTVNWSATDIANLNEDAIGVLLSHAKAFDFCLMGCGPRTLALPIPLRTRFKQVGLRIDMMDTGSACRTYNVLSAEGRAVAAALVAV
ncbi:MAG: hypothetical protein EXR11_07810 [Rhodospirillaceae bacterium]|nr:hypothetical protein [Rhodospirillaceae bacterium]